MSIRKYEAFARVVEMGSLTKAAESLGLTQSGVSHMISGLEEELGFSILIRGRGGIKLTEAGHELLHKVKELLAIKRDIDKLAEDLRGNSVKVIRVGTFTSVAVNWLPHIMKEFEKTNPDVGIKIFSGDYHDVEHWLSTGEIDIGFVSLPVAEGTDFVPLKEEPLFVILTEKHPLAKYAAVPVKEVARQPIISLLRTSNQDVQRALASAGIRPEVRYTTKDDYAIIAMVREGLGVGIMPELLLSSVGSGIAVRPLTPPSSRTIALAFAKNKQNDECVKQFTSCIENWVKHNS